MDSAAGRDVFISHEKSDSDLALNLATKLRALGFTTWCYEEDSTAGGSYLVQIDRAIEAARSMVVIASPQALKSPHVRNEIIRAYELQKSFIPVRRGLAHEDLLRAQDEADDERRREWRMAFGAAVSVPWDPSQPEQSAARIAEGLGKAGIAAPRKFQPSASGPSKPDPTSQLRTFLHAYWTRVSLSVVVALAGIYLNFEFLLAIFERGDTGRFYEAAPLLKFVNFVACVAGAWLHVRALQKALPLIQRDWTREHELRQVIDRQLALIGGWFGLSLLIALFALRSGFDSYRRGLINWLVLSAAVAGLQVLFVRVLFSLPQRKFPDHRPNQ